MARDRGSVYPNPQEDDTCMGNGDWQELTTPPIKMDGDKRMTIYLYSNVENKDFGTSATYDDLLVKEVVNPSNSSNSGSSIQKDYRGHKYFLTTPDTWKGAQAQARIAGGNLVTINDAEEQKWLMNQFGNKEGFWTGLNDCDQENTFEWVSGQPVTYRNWNDGEPNNLQGKEDFVLMLDSNQDGKWQDLCACEFEHTNGEKINLTTIRGIVEIEAKSTSTPNQP